MLAALAASISLLAGARLAGEAGIASSLRARSVVLEGAPERRLAELELRPRLAASLSGALRVEADYAPRLLAPADLSSGSVELEGEGGVRDRAEILHAASLAIRDEDPRGPNLALRAEGAWGRTDLLRAGDGPPQLVPTTGRIRFASLVATAEVHGSPSPRTRLSVRPGVLVIGGADAPAREILPLQRGLTLEASAEWDATRRDLLSVLTTATRARFVPRSDAAHGRAGLRWRRALTAALRSRLAGGVSATWSDTPDAVTRGAGPWAEAALGLAHGQRLEVEASLSLEPNLDPVTGLVDRRLEGALRATLRTRPGWILRAGGGAAWTGAAPSGFRLGPGGVDSRILRAEASAERPFGSFAIGLGAFARRQETSRAGLPSFSELGVHVWLGAETGGSEAADAATPRDGSSAHGS